MNDKEVRIAEMGRVACITGMVVIGLIYNSEISGCK